MKERFTYLPILLVSMFLLSATTSLQLTHFSVKPNPLNESEVIVEWSVNNLSDVTRFELHRKIPSRANRYERLFDADITVTADMRSNPPSSFQFTDNTLYKSSTVADEAFYILRVVRQNGQILESPEERVQYTTSATRRTWGSIKSMFQ